MRRNDLISGGQLAATAFVLMLSPALRLFPAAAAVWAGKGVWLSALLAYPPTALYLYLARRIALRRRAGEGLGELIVRAAPGRAGRMALVVLSLWLCVYAAFSSRSIRTRRPPFSFFRCCSPRFSPPCCRCAPPRGRPGCFLC